MHDNRENVYQIPTAPPMDKNCDQSARQQKVCGNLSVKGTAILGLILLVTSFVTTIGLHFQQQSAWKQGMTFAYSTPTLVDGVEYANENDRSQNPV